MRKYILLPIVALLIVFSGGFSETDGSEPGIAAAEAVSPIAVSPIDIAVGPIDDEPTHFPNTQADAAASSDPHQPDSDPTSSSAKYIAPFAVAVPIIGLLAIGDDPSGAPPDGDVTAAPLPSTMILLGFGLGFIGYKKYRKFKTGKDVQ